MGPQKNLGRPLKHSAKEACLTVGLTDSPWYILEIVATLVRKNHIVAH